MAASALAGALLCASVAPRGAVAQEMPAQEAAVGISAEVAERIENTFALVLGNITELAVPLTRRALARRSIERARGDSAVDPLAYRESDLAADSPESTATVGPAVQVSAAQSAAPVEEGSAEDFDPDIARLPRARPAQSGETIVASAGALPDLPPAVPPAGAPDDAELAMGGPLDLVAGAPVDLPVEVAASDPQPFLTSDIPVVVPASAPPLPLELVASGACLPLGDITDADGDFKRNAETLAAGGFCLAEESFKERKRTWTVATITTGRPGPLFAVMHDDEDMSFDNALEALKTYGGKLVAVETNGRRNQDGIDPNRNFSAEGIGCSKLGDNATPAYTAFFRRLFDPSQPIIALHNNSGERISTGGVGHVSMSEVPKDMDSFPANDASGPLAGERSLVLLTAPVPVSVTAEARARNLSAKGINAVIEGVREGKGDCSLSNYALLSGHPDYLNVTVDEDGREKQKKIIDAILASGVETVATQ